MHTQSYKEQLHAPFDWYRTMRTTQPVFKSPDWGGWQVADAPLEMIKSFVIFGAKQLPMTWGA